MLSSIMSSWQAALLFVLGKELLAVPRWTEFLSMLMPWASQATWTAANSYSKPEQHQQIRVFLPAGFTASAQVWHSTNKALWLLDQPWLTSRSLGVFWKMLFQHAHKVSVHSWMSKSTKVTITVNFQAMGKNFALAKMVLLDMASTLSLNINYGPQITLPQKNHPWFPNWQIFQWPGSFSQQ